MINVVPMPTPLTQLDVTWPALGMHAEGGAFEVNGNPRFGPGSAGSGLFGALVGGGTTAMSRAHNSEVITGRWRGGAGSEANRPLSGFPIGLPLSVQAWPAGYRNPQHVRVHWLQFLMAIVGGNPTDGTGIEFIVSAGTVGGWVTGAVNTGMFGILGDGAGGLTWSRKRGVGTMLATALAWPNAITELTKVDVLLFGASGAGAASLQLWLNDVRVALPSTASTWAAGFTLPIYTDGSVANSNKFVATVQANDGVGIDLHIADLRCQTGHFDLSGAEV